MAHSPAHPHPTSNAMRLSIRLPADLYERLVLLSMGRIGTTGKAELSSIVREALEQYVATKIVRQTSVRHQRKEMP